MQASLYAGLERRQTTRTTLEAITYINFGSDNGGILSNISQGGLCFHAACPLGQTAGFCVWFSAKGHRIEADVELAWADETQKTGGLRFTSLSPEVYEQIRNWISKSTMLATAPEESVPSVRSAQTLRAPSASQSHTSPDPEGPVPVRGLPLEKKAPLLLPEFSRGLFSGLLIAALVVAAFLLGERFGTKPLAETVSPPPARISPVSEIPGKITSSDSVITSASDGHALDRALQEPITPPQTFRYANTRKPEALSRESGTALEKSATQGQPEVWKSTSETIGTSLSSTSSTVPPKSPSVNQAAPLAGRSSPNTQPAKKILATLAQLWASFEAGDSKAAVALAERYMRGDGIPVNCEQARVLLFVASKENNADATKKLQGLEANGCPHPEQTAGRTFAVR